MTPPAHVRHLRYVVIGGPTASGKSELGLALAERFGGEIVNADSRQVYRYLDIGTAKPKQSDQERAPHHLLDVRDPSDPLDAAGYSRLARRAVREVAGRGRLSIVVGGTGLYIRALRGGLMPAPGAQPLLRAALMGLDAREPGALYRWCERLDPPLAERIHRNDRVRLVRALEVALVSGRRHSARQREHGFSDGLGHSAYLRLDPDWGTLAARVETRSRRMWAEGLVEEVRALRERGFGPQLRILQSIGYREAWTVLDGRRSVAEATDDLVRSTLRFAKRQRTWFRGEADASTVTGEADAASRVGDFLETPA